MSGIRDRGDPAHPGKERVRSSLVLPEWMEAGLAGAFAVVLVFLLRDSLAGDPLHTPSVLGTLLVVGLDAARETRSAPGAAAAYNGLHFAVWIALGLLGAHLMRRAEDDRRLWWLPVCGLAAAIAVLRALDVWAQSAGLDLPQLWLGGLAGLAALAGFLVWRHPPAQRS